MVVGGSGFLIDKFHTQAGEGILWLHGYGNVFERVLESGEQIDVEPGGWLYKDPSVRMDTNIQRLATGFFGAMNFITNRFTGPGRLGLQSMYMHIPTAEKRGLLGRQREHRVDLRDAPRGHEAGHQACERPRSHPRE